MCTFHSQNPWIIVCKLGREKIQIQALRIFFYPAYQNSLLQFSKGFKDIHSFLRESVSATGRSNVHTHPSAPRRLHCYSCLSQAKSKMVAPGQHGKHDNLSVRLPTDSPWFLSPYAKVACLHNLLDSTPCRSVGPLLCHGG